MYIESVPNRNSPPAILLRESFRDGAKIKKRTIANLSDWPAELVEGLRTLLKGGTATPADRESIIVRRALPHGHVAAVLGTLRAIGLDRILGPAGNRPRDLVIAMIVARLIAPASKLATARMLDLATAASSLGDILGLGAVDGDELYAAIDWLGERQGAIEQALSPKHLREGTLVLSDVSSSYLEGRCCELARLGYNRDGKKGKLQIVYGLMCAPDGCPVAIEVFEGDNGDPGGADRQEQGAVRPQAWGAGRRPRHDYASAHRRRHRAGRPRLDHGAARPGHPRAGRGRRIAGGAGRPAGQC